MIIAQDCYLKRVSDGQEIPFVSSRIYTDRDSWTWGLEVTVASREAMALVRPTASGPIEVEHGINGYIWRFLVEELEDSYERPGAGYTIKGRSTSCVLAAPYTSAITKTYASLTNANNLAAAEVDPFGWHIDWDVQNWYIPANTISVSEKTPIEIVQEIAQAVGGFLHTKGGFPVGDEIVKHLQIKYRYPSTPSTWSTSSTDETLLPDVILSQSLKWSPQPKNDHIYVMGSENGLLLHIKRTGKPWTNALATIQDQWLCYSSGYPSDALNMAMQRGRNELDAVSYDQTIYTMTTPLPLSSSAAAGTRPKLLLPGYLLSITDLFEESWRGLVTSVSIECRQNVGVTQTIDVERHHTDEEVAE